MSTKTAFFVLASVTFVAGDHTPEAVNYFGRNDLTSSRQFVKLNLKGVPGNGVKDGRRPFFFLREVVGEIRTMDSVGNMIWESRSDFILLNVNRYLLFGKLKAVCTRFHVWMKKGLCFGSKHIC
jgi:hypothetical protein